MEAAGPARQPGKEVCCLRTLPFESMEKALYAWFLDVQARKVPVNGPTLIERARHSIMAFHDKDFSGGTELFQRLKDHYGVIKRAISDENEVVSIQEMDGPVDRPTLIEKVRHSLTVLHDENFTGGAEWLQRLKHHYGVVEGTISGKNEVVSIQEMEEWKLHHYCR